ncbi:MAG TPA: hypothetical protein VF576_10880 [Rubricoccaceae bacterium]|jgi:hypothetical protein
MADLSQKKDPLHLREELPDYVEDKVGKGNHNGGQDVSETTLPTISSEDPTDPGVVDAVDKPTIHLDEEKVARAEREGKGFEQSDV